MQRRSLHPPVPMPLRRLVNEVITQAIAAATALPCGHASPASPATTAARAARATATRPARARVRCPAARATREGRRHPQLISRSTAIAARRPTPKCRAQPSAIQCTTREIGRGCPGPPPPRH